MRTRQQFRFSAQSETLVEQLLRRLAGFAALDEELEKFAFAGRSKEQTFEFRCVIVQGGIDADGAGEYFGFLGRFVEALTVEFGQVTVASA